MAALWIQENSGVSLVPALPDSASSGLWFSQPHHTLKWILLLVLLRVGFCFLQLNQPWILIGRTDAEAEVLILFTSDANSQLIAKDTDAGNYWRQKKKGVAEKLDSIIRENSGGSGRQKGLACYNSWGPMSGTWLTVYTTTILYTFKNDIRNTMLAYLWHFFRIKTFKSSCNIYLFNFKEFYN